MKAIESWLLFTGKVDSKVKEERSMSSGKGVQMRSRGGSDPESNKDWHAKPAKVSYWIRVFRGCHK